MEDIYSAVLPKKQLELTIAVLSRGDNEGGAVRKVVVKRKKRYQPDGGAAPSSFFENLKLVESLIRSYSTDHFASGYRSFRSLRRIGR